MNGLVWLLLGGGALYLWRLKRAGDKISITVLNIGKVTFNLGAITVYVNIAVDNPTGTTLTMRQPNLKLFIEGNEVGNSIPTDEIKTIQANGRTIIKDINIQIPFLNLPGALSDLLTNGLTGKTVKIVAETKVNGIAYKNEKEFKL